MHDFKNKLAPGNILNLFQNASDVHSYNTRSFSLGNFYIKKSNLEIKRKSFSRVGAKWWNEIPNSLRKLPKQVFKKKIHRILLDILSHEDSYFEIDVISSLMKRYS